MTFDGKAFGKDIVTAVKRYIDPKIVDIEARLAAIEAEAEKGIKPRIRVPAGKAGSQ